LSIITGAYLFHPVLFVFNFSGNLTTAPAKQQTFMYFKTVTTAGMFPAVHQFGLI
jgi:hypothetical protein